MRIVVCVKRVPDTEARIRIAESRTAVDPAGLKYIVSPYDEYAVETALRLKEARGEGEVVAVTPRRTARARKVSPSSRVLAVTLTSRRSWNSVSS